MVFIAIVALVAAWVVLRPDRPTVAQVSTPENASPPSDLTVAEADPDQVRSLEVMDVGDDVPAAEPGGAPDVVMPDGVPHTDTCRLIAGWAQRHVPHYTILDNIRDRSMRFTPDDRACLESAKDVPPIVVRFADRYQQSRADRP